VGECHKKVKLSITFQPKAICQRLVDFGQKEKKLLTSFVCFLLSSFWKVGRKNNSA